MIPAAITPTRSDARSLNGRASSDGAPHDDGFDAALAQAAPDSGKPPAADAAPATTAAATDDAAQGLAALLAKLASGTATAAVDVEAAAQGKSGATGKPGANVAGDSDGKSSKSDDGSDEAAVGGTALVADPLANLAALLPGLVAGPAAATVTPAKAALDSAKLAAATGVSLATSADGSKPAPGAPVGGDATAAEPGTVTVLSSIATATHLAPVTPPATQPVPHTAAETTHATSKPAAASAGEPSAPVAAADASSRDAAPTDAVTPRAEPTATLPGATLQALAAAVTSLAADTSPASSPAAQGAAATPVADPTPVSTTPARSLTLQLSPENLGSVTVRLHLTEGGLDVHLAVDDRRTLASISQARDDLAQAIGANGYRVESLVIRGSDASSTSTAGSHDSASSQAQAGAGQGFSGGGSGGGGGDPPASRQRGAPTSPASRDPSRDRGHDGVFV